MANMKPSVTLLLGVVAVFTSGTGALEILNQGLKSIFEFNFETLHREPPPPPPASPLGRSDSVKTLWIKQKLDNFNTEDDRVWDMRYMSNNQFYQKGGPLFIFVGGEWAISPSFLLGGHMYDMAKKHNGYMFYTEHRYYGESKPTKDLSTKNLKYLHVRQALADLAHFIRTMKTSIDGMANSKVILVGGSYSATMVTWFKKLYPELATGCWASSAPLLAKVDFLEYFEVTGRSIRLLGGEQCELRIRNGIAQMEEMLANRRGAEIKAMLKICNNFDDWNDLDIWNLFSSVSGIFAGLVQYHRGQNITEHCNYIMKGEDDFSGFINYLMLYFETEWCNDMSYQSRLKSMLNTEYNDNIMRQWIYQTCNEYGWYQTSGSQNQPFGTKFPVTLYTTMCADIFGAQFTPQVIQQHVDGTNEFFGGLNPNVENVYMTHGHLDPWSAMGIQNETQATIIPYYAHCMDFGSIKNSDTAEMRASKEKIAKLVDGWVGAAK